MQFQHTAARRRLVAGGLTVFVPVLVSTHSRPKAAGVAGQMVRLKGFGFQHTAARRRLDHPGRLHRYRSTCFNTQPPEGGWGSGY